MLSCLWDGACKSFLAARQKTSPDGAVAMSLANGLVGTGIASRYRLQPRAGSKGPVGRCKATTPSSFSLTSNRITTNY